MNFVGLLHSLGPLSIAGLAQGAIYALFALGYTLVYGVLRLINFAHSEVFLMGTYAALNVWGLFNLNQNSTTPATVVMRMGRARRRAASRAASTTVAPPRSATRYAATRK